MIEMGVGVMKEHLMRSMMSKASDAVRTVCRRVNESTTTTMMVVVVVVVVLLLVVVVVVMMVVVVVVVMVVTIMPVLAAKQLNHDQGQRPE
jgi:predicted metalloprotease